jgi:hypothetical protein
MAGLGAGDRPERAMYEDKANDYREHDGEGRNKR